MSTGRLQMQPIGMSSYDVLMYIYQKKSFETMQAAIPLQYGRVWQSPRVAARPREKVFGAGKGELWHVTGNIHTLNIHSCHSIAEAVQRHMHQLSW